MLPNIKYLQTSNCPYNSPEFRKNMFVQKTNKKEIFGILRGLKNKKSSGHDEITMKF